MNTFFVAGGKRTGTTLLESIICSYEGTNPALAEAQLITRLMQTMKWAADPDNFESFVKHTFPQRADLVAYFSTMLSEYVRKTRETHGCSSSVVFKNPEYSLVLDELMEACPGARFIFCVRDPRDQVTSELDVVARRRQLAAGGKPVVGNRDAGQLARNLARYYERVLALATDFPQQILFVRYEDMILDFPATLATLDRFTGLTGNCFDPASRWPRCVEEFNPDCDNYATYSPLYGQPISASSIGRYRAALSPTETRLVEHSCRHLFERFSYPVTQHPEESAGTPPVAEVEAREFLAQAAYSTSLAPSELKMMLARVNALKALPGIHDETVEKLELCRRAMRGTLDWVTAQQALPRH